VSLVSHWPSFSGRVLEVGCGTGTNVLWLGRRGFDVLGLDISAEAVKIARQRAAEAGIACRFAVGDFLEYSLPEKEKGYLLVFDRGCFHSLSEEKSGDFVRQVAGCLQPGGLWFSLMGNADEGEATEKGPPRVTARRITETVEPYFEILQLQSCLIESRRMPQPRFWKCLMRVRDKIVAG
jgi:SAM-dependent methyltransferase